MKNFTFEELKPADGGRGTQFQKFKKRVLLNGDPSQTENFSILAQLESVLKSVELIRLLGGLRPSERGRMTRFKKFEEDTWRTVVPTLAGNFSTLAQLESV